MSDRRGQLLAPAYRWLLITAALAVLWTVPAAHLLPDLLGASGASDQRRQLLGALGLAACITGALTLHYPGQRNVSLLLLPTTLAWWNAGAVAATVIAGFAALLGNAIRLAPALYSLAGGARVTLAVAAGIAAGTALGTLVGDAPGGADGAALLHPPSVVAGAALAIVAGLVDTALAWLDRRLDASRGAAGPALHRLQHTLTDAGASRAGGLNRLARLDMLTNVFVLPVAVLLQAVDAALGMEPMLVLLGGMMALLLVVRTLVNLRTLHCTVAAERRKLAAIFEHSGEGIYTVDGELRIATANPAMAALLGRSVESLVGQGCAAVCRYSDAEGKPLCPERCPLLQAHAEQRPVAQEVLYQAPDRPARHLLLTYTAVRGPGGRLGLGIGIARDVTAQKEAERLREEFVSLLTHELRSPLTVSIGYLTMLKRALQHEADEARGPSREQTYVGRIEDATRHMLRLVNNLLEIARLDHPGLDLELGEVDLDHLLRETVEAARALAASKRQHVSLHVHDAAPRLWTSSLLLQEILTNLLSNAVKYTPEGGSISVHVRARPGPAPSASPSASPMPDQAPPAAEQAAARRTPPPSDRWIEIAVTDTGIGLTDEERARLFTKFFRGGRPEVRRERGTGLGLALTRQMVERLGGAISVQSAPLAGSTFTVTLPLVAPPAIEPRDDAGPSRAVTAARSTS
jgi:PAS domain S-box-containing protein